MAVTLRLNPENLVVQDANVIDGKWQLSQDHQIRFKASRSNAQVDLQATILRPEPNALVITTMVKGAPKKRRTLLLKLKGTWRVDSKNQIVFEVWKKSAKNDVLTFKNEWKIGKNHQISYSYQQTKLKTKQKKLTTLVFEGYWDVFEKNRVTYFLKGSSDSAFRVKGTFQTRSILAKKGAVRYQIGVEVQGKRREKTLTLFGKWKVSRKLGLTFEMEYGKGRKKSVRLTKAFMESESEMFIRLTESLPEKRVEGGISIKW